MEELDVGGQGPISGCCAIEEEEDIQNFRYENVQDRTRVFFYGYFYWLLIFYSSFSHHLHLYSQTKNIRPNAIHKIL
jgi:hypothetical protein